jgi:hypothetical protein
MREIEARIEREMESEDAYMNLQVLWHWLPNLFVVVLVAYPAFFLMRGNAVYRLAVGAISASAFLFLFGEALEPPFSFTRLQDLPPLVLGLGLAWILAMIGRGLRTQLSSGRIW